jgi:hypothetical protein
MSFMQWAEEIESMETKIDPNFHYQLDKIFIIIILNKRCRAYSQMLQMLRE